MSNAHADVIAKLKTLFNGTEGKHFLLVPREDVEDALALLTAVRPETEQAATFPMPNEGFAANRDRLMGVCDDLLTRSAVHRIGADSELRVWVLSVRIALRQFKALLAALDAPVSAPLPSAQEKAAVTAPDAPHVNPDFAECWQSGWRAGYRSSSPLQTRQARSSSSQTEKAEK